MPSLWSWRCRRACVRVLILPGVLRDCLRELTFLETYSVDMDVYPTPPLSMSSWRMADGVPLMRL